MITKDAFAESLQAVLTEQGVKCSKEKAWLTFKGFVKVIVDGVIEDPDDKISLAGIGSFEMLRAAARSSKIGLVDFVPKLRWRTSSKIDAYMEEATGQVPDPEKRQALKEKLRAEGKITSNLPPRDPKAKTEEKATGKSAETKPETAPAEDKAAEKPAETSSGDEFEDEDF